MKTILAFSLLLPLFGGIIYTKASGSNKKPEGAVVSYSYCYRATMAYPRLYYQVGRDSSGTVCIAWQKEHCPDVTIIRSSDEVLKRIEAIAAEYRLHKIKRIYTPSVQVLDGTSWDAYLRYEKGSISSSGSNAKAPKKLMDGIYAINDYIQSQIDASSESDIIAKSEYYEYSRKH